MRTFILAALAGAVMLPFTIPVADAAPRHHQVRRDRHHVRHERRELRHARHMLRDDRRARNHDWRWYRSHDRARYHRGHWHAPFRYHRFRAGIRIAPVYYSSRYYIARPAYYHLPPAGPFQRWVRHYDDVLLIDVRTGYVVEVLPNFYW